jgi:RND family efflux transporter MFP subunit
MKRTMQMKQKMSGWTLALVAPILVGLWGCGGAPAPKQAAPETASGIEMQTVELATIPNEVAAPGTVASIRTAQVAARVMSTVDQVTVREGDRIHQGQVLIVLDGREFAARRSAAEAGLAQAAAAEQEAQRGAAAAEAQASVAEKTYKRYVYLRDEKSVSPQEFDEVEAKQQAAQAMLAQAHARQQQAAAALQQAKDEVSAASTVSSYTRIVAPFDGVVLQRFVDPGAMATPGTPLLSVEETSRYRLEATVDAENMSGIRVGRPVPVALDAFPGKRFAGKVAEIEPGANPASHTVQVKIDLPADPALRSGLFGRAWFRQGERQAIVVPETAILERGQLRAVYVVDPAGIIHLRLVTLGAKTESGPIVLSGLGAGDRVVTNPGSRDLDGKKAEAGR